MREHPAVPLIRVWLLAAALLLLCVLWPEIVLALWPLSFVPSSCCCAAACTIFNDPFATDRTGTDYNVRSGSWSVAAGVMTCTSASALIREETSAGAGATAVWVTATVTPATTSDIGRVGAGYVDDNNYWFAEIKQGATNGTLKLFRRSGGSNTQQGSTATVTGYTSGAISVCICLTPTAAIAIAGNGAVNVSASPTVASTKAILGTGTGTTSVSFDDFLYSNHKLDNASCQSCCGGSTCAKCSTGSTPQEVQVVWTGIANGGPCTNCNLLNITVVLTPPDDSTDPGNWCCAQQSPVSGTNYCGLGNATFIVSYYTGALTHIYIAASPDAFCMYSNPIFGCFKDLTPGGGSQVDCSSSRTLVAADCVSGSCSFASAQVVVTKLL